MAINNVSGNTLLQSGFFPPVRVASTGSPLTPTTGGLLTVDGVTLVAGDRVLCKDETSAVNNGIYAANTGPWVRTSDASTNQQFFSGMAIICAQGATNAKTIFICTCTDNPVVVGTSLITFAAQLPVGAGNVIGPGSSTTGDVATFSNSTGQLLQDTSTSGTGQVLKANSPTMTSPTLVTGTSGNIIFQTSSPTEALRITSDGHQLIGLTSALTSLGLNTQFLTVENAGRSGEPGGNHALFQFSNDASSAYLSFFKTRATTKGSSVTAVQNADGLGEINYNGADGTSYVPQCVYVDALVEGAVSTGIIPTAYVIGTMDAFGVVFERFRLTHEGNLNIIGSLSTNTPRFISATSYTTNTTDSTIIFNASGTVTITLTTPASPVFTAGRWLIIKTITNNAVVSASANVAPLAGGSVGTAILAATAGKWAALQWDGANWDIMMAN